MRKISLVVPDPYKNNGIFDIDNRETNRDDSMRPFFSLKQDLESHRVNLSTHDINSVDESDLIIFMNMPDESDLSFAQASLNNKKRYLIISELGLICQGNDDLTRHKDFMRIFTYQDNLIGSAKYCKINYSFDFTSIPDGTRPGQQKLCALIAGNKTLNHPLELYSKRIEAIRWFENNYPEDFDLYGTGWDGPNYFHGSTLKRVLNHSRLLRHLFSRPFPSYRGKIERKYNVLRKYKFSICYENARDVPGWITEKIFDCFFAGCIPVYWGADNVAEHIPRECFVDKRSFGTYEDLYEHMISMTDAEYKEHLAAVANFLQSEKAYQFSIKYFVETLTREILCDLA